MSVSYRGTTLPEANTDWDAPALAGKDWGFFGANGQSHMHGGTRGRNFSVSGICPFALNATIEGWLDGAVGDAIIDAEKFSVLNILDTFGEGWSLLGIILYKHKTSFS